MSAYIDAHRGRFGVEPICRVLGVAPSSYYAARVRPPSARALCDAWLVGQIHHARAGYRRVYGIRKTWRELSRRGIEVGRDRVGRLMRAEGLEGVRRGRRHRTTTPDERAADRARDLVERRFVADAPNRLWVADITYIRTYAGFVYLAFILDVFSRKVVGWQIATHMRAQLVLDALGMAVAQRRPGAGVIAHSDHGSQTGLNRSSQHLEGGGGLWGLAVSIKGSGRSARCAERSGRRVVHR
jgi:putative transposase